jgi:hypothetical protein
MAVIARHRVVRVIGALYPALMLLVIVATGNHFFLDAALGGVAVLLGWLLARAVVAPPTQRPTAARVATSAGRA